MKRESMIPSPLGSTAKELRKHFKKRGYSVSESTGIDETNRYKAHLVFKKVYETIAVEIRQKCDIQHPFLNFVQACQANRVAVKIYFAVPEIVEGEETTISHTQMSALRTAGIGLFVVNDSGVREEIGTVPCNRRIALEPGGSLGKYATKVNEITRSYNLGDCLDAIRDLSEEVEDATTLLCAKAAKKGKINIAEADVLSTGFNWEDKINVLAASNYRGAQQTRFLDQPTSQDLKSFKDTRNLSDHRKTVKDKRRLEAQYPDKVLQGVRLLRELVKLIKRA